MPQASRLTTAKSDVFSFFESSGKRVYTQAELAKTLNDQRSSWGLAARTTAQEFVQFLIDHKRLTLVQLRSDAYEREVVRYAWDGASIYQLALSIRKGSYLTHTTAVHLHGLTDLIPKTVYLNIEQSPKPRPQGELTQAAVDRAFANQQRQSNLSYVYGDWTVTVISGKNTGRLGVEEVLGPAGEKLDATNIERTLIDIVVRPTYAGGIFEVYQAYKAAKDVISVNRLVSILKKLDYIYPYHQSIGFLMQRAGYDAKRYSLLQDLGINIDFHLTHGIENPQYDPLWRLYFPQGL